MSQILEISCFVGLQPLISNSINIEQFFPRYLTLIDSEICDENITLHFKSNRSECTSPTCNKPSTKPSTMYTRTLQDKAFLDKETMLEIKLRKYEHNVSYDEVTAVAVDDFCLKKNDTLR